MSDIEQLASRVTVEFPGDPRTRIGRDVETVRRLSAVVKVHNIEFDKWWEEFSADLEPGEMDLVARYAMGRLMLAETKGVEVGELQEQLQRSYDKGVLVELAAERIFEAAGMEQNEDDVSRRLSTTIREILSSADEERLRTLAADPGSPEVE